MKDQWVTLQCDKNRMRLTNIICKKISSAVSSSKKKKKKSINCQICREGTEVGVVLRIQK